MAADEWCRYEERVRYTTQQLQMMKPTAESQGLEALHVQLIRQQLPPELASRSNE